MKQIILNNNFVISQSHIVKDCKFTTFFKINEYVYVNSKDNTVDVLRYEDLSLISNINNDGMYIQCCLHVGRDHLIIGGE